MRDAPDLLPPPTRTKGTQVLWSDGLHYVRRAGARDKHQMRFIAASHRALNASFQRYAPTADRAIEIAKGATKLWLKQHPVDAALLEKSKTHGATAPSPSDSQSQTRGAGSASVGSKPQAFATTLFDCVYANPVAQVWMMTREPGEQKPVGRRKANGRAADQAPIVHTKGQCAVMKGDEVVRNEDGSVRVFHTLGEAEEFAAGLYLIEPEENTILWRTGHVRVAATGRVEVHFNPSVYGAHRPFVLWMPEYQRCVYVDRTRPTITREGLSTRKIEESGNAELAMALKEARARAAAEDRQPSFTERPLRFRSIQAAIEEADRRERMLLGELVR